MPRDYYMPQDDSGKTQLLEHLAITLPAYAELLAIHPDEITGLQADALAMRYTLTARQTIENNARQWTAFRSVLRDGGSGDGEFPFPPTLAPPVPAVPPGVIPRLAALVVRIKAARNYTEAIGRHLAIVGPQRRASSSSWQPTLDITLAASHPVIQWTKGEADALEIWADRADGQGFALVTITTDPRYEDLLPRVGAVWQYKAIYILRDTRVGKWSNVASLAVGS